MIVVGGSIFIVTGIVIVGIYHLNKKGIKVRLKKGKPKVKVYTSKAGTAAKKELKKVIDSAPYARAGQKKG